MRSQKLFVTVWVCLMFCGTASWTQVTTGTISGTVSDSTGAVIPGANISIRNVDTGVTRDVIADASGRYRAQQLLLGNYDVTATSAGFQTLVRSGITLTVGREATVDLVLQVGAVSEKLTVTGEAPLIETTNATVSSLVDERAMRALPLNGRSFSDLTSLQPGVIADLPIAGTGGTQNVYSGGGTTTKRIIGGNKPQLSSYLLDGMEISTPSNGMPVNSVLGEQLGVEAIREFSVLQNNFGPQYGRAAGGVVNAVTQSGTNVFHGSVFEFLRNDALDARDFFLLPTQPKAPLRRNQFGASLGGPIQKDRTFFFVDYEGVRQSAGVSRIGATLTPQTRQGQVTNNQGQVFETLSVNPDIQPIINLLPLPTVLSNGSYNYQNGGVADYNSIPLWNATENYGITRTDHQISEKDSLFGRLTVDRSIRNDNFELRTPTPYKGTQTGGYVLATVSETHIFSPSVLNTARVGFTRRNDNMFNNYQPGGDQFPNPTGLDPRLSLIHGYPWAMFQISGVNLYNGPQYFIHYIDNTFDYNDSLIVNRGLHSISVGGELKRYRMNANVGPWANGWVNWLTIERFLTNQPFDVLEYISNTGPQSTGPGSLVPDVYRGWRQTYGAFYVGDEYKVFPSLTLNLGIRWERITGPKEVNGKLASLQNVFQGNITLLRKDQAMFNPRDAFKGFSPRFGFAWTPFANQKTVFRGGFGIFKDEPQQYEYQLSVDAPPYAHRVELHDPPGLKFPFPFRNAAGLDDPSFATGVAEPVIVPMDAKVPYSMQWTFSLEKQLTSSLVVKANYLGSRGLDLFGIYNPIQPVGQTVNGRYFVPPDSPILNPNFGSIRLTAPFGSQWYQSGQLVVEKRLGKGLGFNGSYTFSRNIDISTSAGTRGGEIISGTANATYNSDNFAGEKGLSGLHVKHNFITSYSYDLPFGPGRPWGNQWKGVLGHVAGGWMLNGTLSTRSGLPVNLTEVPLQSRCRANQCPERPDLKPGGNNNPVLKNWTPNQYFDPSNFMVQPAGFYGNLGRQTLISPGLFNLNLSLAKDNRISEKLNLAFRGEFFNILNHPNFGVPATSVFRDAAGNFTANVGRITTTANSMRQIQFGLKLTF